MRIGALIDVEQPLGAVVEQVGSYAEDGFASAWATQIFGYDALTMLAVVGAQVPGIGLGTGVVPVYSRHPQVMAQQALTV
ncbi:F420-dependent N5 N10-methylene tetrahydromethanopterin reductase-like protein, partial [mine drainage metagenome]